MSVALRQYSMQTPSSFLQDPQRKVHRELLAYIYEHHLTAKTMPNIDRQFVHQNEFGWTSLAFDAKSMQLKPAHARSMPSLLKKIEYYGYQYYRPNLSYTSKSHKKRQLRWMIALIFDFDQENLQRLRIGTLEQLIGHVESFGYEVSGVIRTTTGYHVYLPMIPLRGEFNGQKTIQRYDQVLKRMAKQLGSDPHAASAEHYFRTPQPQNVVYFHAAEKPDFEFYEKKMGVSIQSGQDSKPSSVSFGRLMSQEPMLKMLSGDFNPNAAVTNPETGESRCLGRNNAAFTLALAMKADGWTVDQATDELKQWYIHRISRHDFNWSEVFNTIKHAFEGEYKGPSPLYVQAFTGLKLRPLSKRKSKEDRVRLHFNEIEESLITYLQRHYLEFEKDLMMPQAKLAQELHVSLRSLQHVLRDLKTKGIIDVHTKREGRSNVSIYFLSEQLLPKASNGFIREDNQDGTAISNSAAESLSEAVATPQDKSRIDEKVHTANSSTYFLAIGRPLFGSRSLLRTPGVLGIWIEVFWDMWRNTGGGDGGSG